jgi:hypothetical protein
VQLESDICAKWWIFFSPPFFAISGSWHFEEMQPHFFPLGTSSINSLFPSLFLLAYCSGSEPIGQIELK